MDKDKLKFAKNCKMAEIGFKNRKKLLKDAGIAFTFPAIFAIIMSILLNLILLSVVLFEVLLYGAFATYAHLCNRDDISKCNVGTTNFTYKDYKQMKKSGELDKLYQKVEEMNKQEAEENYQRYLEFVNGKTYTPVKTSSVENIQETDKDNEIENNNNL